jgi:putative NADH-flavin reductase
MEGDVLHETDVQRAIAGADVVISALGTDGAQTLSKSMPNIIRTMKENHISRIITVGTAGILQARSNPSVYRFQSSESRRKSTAAAEDLMSCFVQVI